MLEFYFHFIALELWPPSHFDHTNPINAVIYSALFINRKTKQYSGRHDYVFLAESKGLNK